MKKGVLELRPTQFAVGMLEVESRVHKIRGLKGHELEKYLDERPVPIVLCRNGETHIIDRHHLVRACWEAGVEKVKTETKADFSHLEDGHFWAEMARLKWARLHDQFGKGPHEPHLLPLDVRGMADDLYRSLAWAVREAGAFEKQTIPFCEFHWADFFRARLRIPRTTDGLKQATVDALKLAASPDAKHLPGYKGKSSP